MRARTLAICALALLTLVPVVSGMPVANPVTKGLSHGAIFQAPLSGRSCYGADRTVHVGRQRCTTMAALKKMDSTVAPAIAPDGRTLYLASQGGVLALARAPSGALSALQCMRLTGPCDGFSEDGTNVSQLVMARDGRHLYALVTRQRDGGTELHALARAAHGRLAPDPSCLLLIRRDDGLDPENGRGCRITEGELHVDGHDLALTPDGHFAYLVEAGQTRTSITAMSAGPSGSLTPLPGCMSADGLITNAQNGCRTLLPRPQTGADLLDIKNLGVTADSRTLIARGNILGAERGDFLVGYEIGGDGALTLSSAANACVSRQAAYGCKAVPEMLGVLTDLVVSGSHAYTTSFHIVDERLDRFGSNLLSFRISAAGGLTLPAGRLGCNGFISDPTTIRKLGSCSLAREPMRSPVRLTLGPHGTLYVVGLLGSSGRGIGLYRVGATGVPSPAPGIGGCLLDGQAIPERALCNRVFAEGSLSGVDTTLVVSPDGHWAYAVDQPLDAPRLVVLRRVP